MMNEMKTKNETINDICDVIKSCANFKSSSEIIAKKQVTSLHYIFKTFILMFLLFMLIQVVFFSVLCYTS